MRDGILFEPLSEYAVKWNVVLRRLPSGVGSLGGVGGQLRALLRPAYHWLRSFGRAHARLEGRAPRVAVEMYFSGIMRQPIYNTEFFWYREPSLPRGAVFAYFAHAEDQPTKPRQAILSDAGIGWMAKTDLHRIMDAHWSHIGRPREPADVRASGTAGTKIRKVLRRYVTDFYSEHDRWCRFFTATGTRIHVSTSDSFPASEALHAALADVGGVSVSIPRAIERTPNIFRRTVTDVHFAFSRAQSDREGLSGSSVRQFITSGYLFDDAFPAAMEFAREIVSQLRARGVTFTVCFLDENAGVDRKMYGGGRLTQSDYAFLCDRLAVDESLGLILKPKRSDTLPERLGPVWPRVEEFMRTGRCVLLDGGSTDERYLPCAGACAADIAVNMLRGATAGLESYLAGTRTLLIRHGEDLGVFERLPQGSVVFDTWDELWRAVERFRADPADPNIGNWEPIIEEFASLRDSCASKRISSYITALYEAFASGKSREEAMGHAGRRYADMWGADLITPIVGAWPQHAQAVRAQRDDWLQVGLRA